MTIITNLLKLQILCLIFSLNLYLTVTLTTTVEYDEDDSDEDNGNILSRKSSTKFIPVTTGMIRTTVFSISSAAIKYITSPKVTTLSNVRVTSAPTLTTTFNNIRFIRTSNRSIETTTTNVPPTTSRISPIFSPFFNYCQNFQCENKVDETKYSRERSNSVFYFGDCGNKSFYVTNQEFTSQSFHTGCCYAGLYPATMETSAEFECLNNHHIRHFGMTGKLQLFSSIGDFSRRRRFVNCPSNKRISEELWALDEPDNKGGTEMCSQLVICAHCSYSGVYDVSCSVKGKTLCQGHLTSTTTTKLPPSTNMYWKTEYVGPNDPVSIAKPKSDCDEIFGDCSPKFMPAEKQKFIKSAYFWDMLFLNECNGKMFFITKTIMLDHWRSCCNAGLIPAVIKSRTELDCIRANANIITGVKGELTTFTVYRDKFYNRTFMSCLDNSMVSDDLWIQGQPDDKDGHEVCALVNICSNCRNPGFADVNCDYANTGRINGRILCQNRV